MYLALLYSLSLSLLLFLLLFVCFLLVFIFVCLLLCLGFVYLFVFLLFCFCWVFCFCFLFYVFLIIWLGLIMVFVWLACIWFACCLPVWFVSFISLFVSLPSFRFELSLSMHVVATAAGTACCSLSLSLSPPPPPLSLSHSSVPSLSCKVFMQSFSVCPLVSCGTSRGVIKAILPPHEIAPALWVPEAKKFISCNTSSEACYWPLPWSSFHLAVFSQTRQYLLQCNFVFTVYNCSGICALFCQPTHWSVV